MYKLLLLFCCCCNTLFMSAQTITAAEYFINADPGAGNGIPIPVTAGTTASFTAAIPVNALPPGFHFLGIRAKSVDGTWGMFETRGFYISTATMDVSTITAAEYFIDSDPGKGNGIAIAVAASNTVPFTATIPVGSLAPGFHFIAIRTKDANGKWGLFETRGFYISTATTDAPTITAAEYFIDTDPGKGNGTAIAIAASNTVPFTATIPLGSLAQGFHFLAIRTKDANGKWGLFETRGFYISTQATNVADITAAEYFYDTDPGFGNGIAVPVSTATSFYKDSLLLPVGSLPLGNHSITLRVKNEAGEWSLLESKFFNICTRNGPLSKTTYHIENNRVFFTNMSTDNDTTLWKFGDGTTDTVLQPVKTYTAAGNYNLQLISKNVCGADTLRETIRINGLHSVNSPRVGNIGVATLIFEGNGFTASTPFQLQKGATVILPIEKKFISSNRVAGFFNFNGADTGRYDVIANLGGGPLDTLKKGFTVAIARYPDISIVDGGRNPARLGFMNRTGTLQNRGNEDAIMIPFATVVGHKPGTIALSSMESFVDLTNKGIFQNTFEYLSANGISGNVMEALDVDTIRKKQLLAYYRVRIPAESFATNYYRIFNSFGQLTYDNRSLVHPPLYKSTMVLNDVSAPNARDCMNSFLKKAVKRNISVTIGDAAWNSCFNTAFDTLSKSIRDIVKDISLQEKSIPMKSVYATLLVQMTKCGASGMPAALTPDQFQNIIKDVTYNWLFLENLDSIGRPCFDTTETFVFRNRISGKTASIKNSAAPTNRFTSLNNDNCPGAQFFPELAELCKDFADPCAAVKDVLFKDDNLFNTIGRKVFDKFTGLLGPPGSKGFCAVNSATIGCRKLCELASFDPNVKFGPGDNNNLKHVNYLSNYGYTIFFENLASASAPAAYVEITDTLDLARFDIHSFQINGFGWGDTIVITDANRGNYSLLKDLRPALPNKLRIDVRVDTIKGIVQWKFLTVDTATLQLTNDPAEGFLPPNTDGKKGVGFVSFSIKPKTGLVSGDKLNNKASIVFDENEAIITPVWQHIIDTLKPQSKVTPLPAVTNTARFEVKWSGTDAHAGVDEYAVYVSVNDSLFKKWKNFTSAVSDTFTGEFNKTYKFFSVAVDRAGNYEDAPLNPLAVPDAVTTVQIATNVSNLVEEKILVYPTVTSGIIFIRSDKKLQAELYSAAGVKHAEYIIRSNGEVNISHLPSGVYFLKLRPSSKVIKIIKL